MTGLLASIRRLVEEGQVLISLHGRERLAANAIAADEVRTGIHGAEVVEEYLSAWKGPTILVLQRDTRGRPLHVLWGMARDRSGPAVLVTAYRPDPRMWTDDFKARRQ